MFVLLLSDGYILLANKYMFLTSDSHIKQNTELFVTVLFRKLI